MPTNSCRKCGKKLQSSYSKFCHKCRVEVLKEKSNTIEEKEKRSKDKYHVRKSVEKKIEDCVLYESNRKGQTYINEVLEHKAAINHILNYLHLKQDEQEEQEIPTAKELNIKDINMIWYREHIQREHDKIKGKWFIAEHEVCPFCWSSDRKLHRLDKIHRWLYYKCKACLKYYRWHYEPKQ